ncbi:hypothetical protein MRX96_006486 [Rhipicephalus microplus]
MALPLISSPKQFEPGSDPAEAWSEWKSAYQLYEAASEGEQRTDMVAAIFEPFDERYLPYKSVMQATAILNAMCQKEDQPIDDFIA